MGEYAYDIPLPHGIWTRGNQGLPHTRLRRVVQIAADLAGKPLAECRVLDLGCLDGIFSIEFAQQGAEVVGVEVRDSNLRKAEFARQVLGLDRLTFVLDDARNITVDSHGRFDVVLCSGLLYHLDGQDVFRLVEQMHAMTDRVLIVDTHISLSPTLTVRHRGETYAGHSYKEHDANDLQEVKDKRLWASIDNPESFWPTRPSLINLLSSTGFSSVYECFAPEHLNFGRPGMEHLDRVTFVAVQGQRVRIGTSPTVNTCTERYPEGTLGYAPPAPSVVYPPWRRVVSRIRQRLR